MSTLPYDVLRQILSSEEIPCSTKVDLQKDLGSLTSKVYVSDDLKAKLDRIYTSRKPKTLLQGLNTEYCNIVSPDGKISFRIVYADGTPYMSYTFTMRRKGGVVMTISRDNVFGENNWYTSTSRTG